MLQQAENATTMGRRDRINFTQTQRVEINNRLVRIESVSFVGYQERRFLARAQMFRNSCIRWHQASTRIHHEQHNVRFFDSQQRLFRHTGFNTVFGAINTAGINTDKLAAFNFRTTVLTVTSQTREIRNQRISGAS